MYVLCSLETPSQKEVHWPGMGLHRMPALGGILQNYSCSLTLLVQLAHPYISIAFYL